MLALSASRLCFGQSTLDWKPKFQNNQTIPNIPANLSTKQRSPTCSVYTIQSRVDGVDIKMVATWVPRGTRRSLCGRQHGCHMDALWERTESVSTLTWLPHGCFVGTDGVCVDVNMIVSWMSTWLPHGCSAGTDGGWVDVNMVATWMLCGNGRSLRGR